MVNHINLFADYQLVVGNPLALVQMPVAYGIYVPSGRAEITGEFAPVTNTVTGKLGRPLGAVGFIISVGPSLKYTIQ